VSPSTSRVAKKEEERVTRERRKEGRGRKEKQGKEGRKEWFAWFFSNLLREEL
jgi:hypothetical protein